MIVKHIALLQLEIILEPHRFYYLSLIDYELINNYLAKRRLSI